LFARKRRSAQVKQVKQVKQIKEAQMPTMRVMQIAAKGGPFEWVERELPQPGRGEVRVKVQACGVCHSDSLAKEGLFPNITYPIVPGHEIAGIIDAVGEGVVGWTAGTRVGVGWFGGHCGHCDPCRRGHLVDCRNLRIPGLTYDGGLPKRCWPRPMRWR
jgi:D-arabinose 1-dehydrogenase-like Zn-dependent alcohol dehydrogenase